MEKLDDAKFTKLFLINFFKRVLKEKEAWPAGKLDEFSKNLADLFIKEFGTGNSPENILGGKNIEQWLNEKIEFR